MKKEKKDKHFIHRPIYDGGLKAMRAFLSKNKKHPEEALKEKIEGTVVLKYTVSYKGDVISAKVVKGLGYGCDEEAIRLVKLLKFRVPKNRGKRVKFHKSIQIHFRLPQEKSKPAATQVVYTITPAKKDEKREKGKEEKGGGYTISF